MKQILKVLMIMLSYSPLATVAVAAQAKASEIDGENQNAVMKKNLRAARYRVLADGQTTTTVEAAKKRYAEVTGLEGAAAEEGATKDLQVLSNHGILNINEKSAVSGGPSRFAF